MNTLRSLIVISLIWLSSTATMASQFDAELLQLVNAERSRAGLSALTLSSLLNTAAQNHATDMSLKNFFSHTGSNGSSVQTRVAATGYNRSLVGENIAAGSSTAAAVMEQWMNSPEHRGNILNPNYVNIGFGYAFDSLSDFAHYWVQVFGGGTITSTATATATSTATATATATATSTSTTAATGTSTATTTSGNSNTWYTSKIIAQQQALLNNKLLLMVAHNNPALVIQDFFRTKAEQDLIRQQYVLWITSAAQSTGSSSDYFYYFDDVLNPYLSTVAVIDPTTNKALARFVDVNDTERDVYLSLKKLSVDGGAFITPEIWFKAQIDTVEKGRINAVWQYGGEDRTSRGDRVMWGYFYASANDVSWGSEVNPDLFVKVWFDVSGRIDVNFFHVSVPNIHVYSSKNNNTMLTGTTTTNLRYVRHMFARDGTQAAETTNTSNSAIKQLTYIQEKEGENSLQATIYTQEKGAISGFLKPSGKGGYTARGDKVGWGYFYASPMDVAWGSVNNPEVFVKIWTDVSGRKDMNFFHVSVPSVEVASSLVDAQQKALTESAVSTVSLGNRYSRHEFSPR